MPMEGLNQKRPEGRESSLKPEQEKTPEQGILYDKMRGLFMHPSPEKLYDFLESYEQILEAVRKIDREMRVISFGLSADPVVLFLFKRIPQNEDELREAIRGALQDKRVLEIGAGQHPNSIFQEYAKDYLVVERDIPSVSDSRIILRDFYKEKGIKWMTPEEFDKTDEQFDIICSIRVWYDGDLGSCDWSDRRRPANYPKDWLPGWYDFVNYHKKLKTGGLAYHETMRDFSYVEGEERKGSGSLITIPRIIEILKEAKILNSGFSYKSIGPLEKVGIKFEHKPELVPEVESIYIANIPDYRGYISGDYLDKFFTTISEFLQQGKFVQWYIYEPDSLEIGYFIKYPPELSDLTDRSKSKQQEEYKKQVVVNELENLKRKCKNTLTQQFINEIILLIKNNEGVALGYHDVKENTLLIWRDTDIDYRHGYHSVCLNVCRILANFLNRLYNNETAVNITETPPVARNYYLVRKEIPPFIKIRQKYQKDCSVSII